MQVAEKTSPIVDRHHLSASKLEALGVQLLNRYDLDLKCENCGETWAPTLLPDGRLPLAFWKCPNRCNW